MTDVTCLKIGRVVTALVAGQMLLACEGSTTATGLAMELSIFHPNHFVAQSSLEWPGVRGMFGLPPSAPRGLAVLMFRIFRN
jgi:hypothetical protein